MSSCLLSLLIWIPILGSGLILIINAVLNFLNLKYQDYLYRYKINTLRIVAIIIAVIVLLLSLILLFKFDPNSMAMQFTEDKTWIAALNIHYRLGIDGIALVMILLTNFTGLIVILAACQSIKTQVAAYLATFLILQGVSVGVFAATDAVIFYIFWEAMLIPMYLCIGIWGDKDRAAASIKFFLYAFFGSALMLAALLYLGLTAHSFNLQDLYNLPLSYSKQILIFIAFLLAFAIKVPMWPVHTWLPDVHTAAPAGGSVVLAALMLKMGIYGFIRFLMPIAPLAAAKFHWAMIILALIAIIYIALIALVQKDFKRLIAYSSIAHMGFAILACFIIYSIVPILNNYNKINLQDAYLSLEGGIVQMVAHAFSTGALFLGIGWLYERFHSRSIEDYRGIAQKMPIFATFFMLFALSNVALPGTAGFVGEWMIILSAFQAKWWVALLAATTLLLAAAYTLLFYKKIFFGAVQLPASTPVAPLALTSRSLDLNKLELFIFILLAIPVIFIGLDPNGLLNLLHSAMYRFLLLSL